jgi:hypothetical protein
MIKTGFLNNFDIYLLPVLKNNMAPNILFTL